MRFSIALLAVVLFVACKDKSGISGDHLSPKLMQLVLEDINLAESYSTMLKDSTHRTGTKNFDSLAIYYKMIFQHYNISPEQFAQSLDWYKSHPDNLDSVYTKVTTNVTKWQAASTVNTPIKPMPKADTALIRKVQQAHNNIIQVQQTQKPIIPGK